MRDPRIRAFVSLDLGMAQGFTRESLAEVSIPALLIGAGVDIGEYACGKRNRLARRKSSRSEHANTHDP